MGLTWDIIANDPLCGMSTSLIVHAVEWPLLLLLAVYFDQVASPPPTEFNLASVGVIRAHLGTQPRFR